MQVNWKFFEKIAILLRVRRFISYCIFLQQASVLSFLQHKHQVPEGKWETAILQGIPRQGDLWGE